MISMTVDSKESSGQVILRHPEGERISGSILKLIQDTG
jgi:hypothetical protein